MKRDYLSSLSRAARWYLPPAEAAEVLEDYQDIVGREQRSEEQLRRDLGGPRSAARQLAQPKAYRRWIAVFLTLAAILLLPAADMFLAELWGMALMLFHIDLLLNGIANASRYAEAFFPVGMLLSFAWFQRNGSKARAPWKKILPLLLLVLLGMAWVWFVAWVILEMRFEAFDFLFPDRGWIIRLTLSLNALIAGLVGIAGLVKARLEDRRWRAVYVWGLAGVVLNIFLWKVLASMSIDFSGSWQLPYLIRLVTITAAGILGTAVSLC